MKIIVDINHPAHVHFFRHFISEIRASGAEVVITATSKDITFELLGRFGLKYIDMGSYGKNMIVKYINFIIVNFRMLFVLLRERPDIVVSISSARPFFPMMLGARLFVFTDTEHAVEQIRLFRPFAEKIITPDCFKGDLGPKQIRYPGYHELAYLHPARFTPNPAVLGELGMKEGDVFFIVRFVAWQATHDRGQHGFSSTEKLKLVELLNSRGRVIISSECSLPGELDRYRMSIDPVKMHDLLYYATIYVGEGGTMASEAAVIGTPSIFVNTLTMGYTEEEEKKYGLLFHTDNYAEAERHIARLLEKDDVKQEWRRKREILLKDKCDPSSWMLDFFRKHAGR